MTVILNGKLPDSVLMHLPWPKAAHLRCRTDAAESLGRVAEAFEAHFGTPLRITDGYRTFEQQVALKLLKGDFAAKPGTSNHGLGIAIDAASDINEDGTDEHEWMVANGPSFGWINPEWAVNFDPSDGRHEPWHWEYHPELDKHARGARAMKPRNEEIDMDDTQARQLAEIHAILAAGDAVKIIGANPQLSIPADTHDIRAALTAALPELQVALARIREDTSDVRLALTNTLPVLLGAAAREGTDAALITDAVVAAIPASIVQDVLNGLSKRLNA